MKHHDGGRGKDCLMMNGAIVRSANAGASDGVTAAVTPTILAGRFNISNPKNEIVRDLRRVSRANRGIKPISTPK